jgi:hypothetical protein
MQPATPHLQEQAHSLITSTQVHGATTFEVFSVDILRLARS